MQTCKCKFFENSKILGLMGRLLYCWGTMEKLFYHCHPNIETINLCTTLHKKSRPRFNSNQTFLLVQKLKSAHGIYTRNQGWTRKNLFNLPQVINKCWTLWPWVSPKSVFVFWRIFATWPPKKKKGRRIRQRDFWGSKK